AHKVHFAIGQRGLQAFDTGARLPAVAHVKRGQLRERCEPRKPGIGKPAAIQIQFPKSREAGYNGGPLVPNVRAEQTQPPELRPLLQSSLLGVAAADASEI